MNRIVMIIGTKAIKLLYAIFLLLILDFFFKTNIKLEHAIIISALFVFYDLVEHFLIGQMLRESTRIITK